MNHTSRLIAAMALVLTAGMAMAGNRLIRYDGPGSGLDYATDVTVDDAGNVYVSGASTGSATGLDFTVLSLSPEDSLRWVYRWNQSGASRDVARAVAVGPDGNVYAAGYTVNPVPYYDVVVLSLTPEGVLRWVRIHQGEGGGEDSANAIAIDADGNIYTAGVGDDIYGENTEFSVLSFEPDTGGLRWVYVASADYVDEATDVVVGPDSTVFASGVLWSGAYRSAFVVAAVNSTFGTQRWLNSFTRGDDDSRADGIAYHAGKVYAAGYTGGNFKDFTVAAYDADSGTRSWLWFYSASTGRPDQAYDVKVGPDGTAYACGRTVDSMSTHRFSVAGITPDGATRWLYCRPGGADGRFELANEIAQGPDGHLYACGWTDAGWPYDGDSALVVSLDTAGNERWAYTYSSAVRESLDIASAIAVTPGGRVYAVGSSTDPGHGPDIVVFSLDPDQGVAESPAPQAPSFKPQAAGLVVRGSLTIPAVSGQRSGVGASLLDASGRKVLDLRPGPNDVRGLAPGVYFIRSRPPAASCKLQSVRKVVIQR